MYWVYMLWSKDFDQWYVGYSDNLKKRLEEHNKGQSFATKPYIPWELVYCEGYKSHLDALDRERKLKNHGKGMQMLKIRLKRSVGLLAKR
ncbi:hypothetical protein A3D85_00785 [Candidatus Amesbacteria bacterium RIFCSPHIGHO2_02_FULL_47_9]|nr:MAG: hypothetical protein A3D85_00785 [Candidatus Amesbacteria bacterium RIFCSPHIGHO2_02_FULL_47_9]